MTASESSKFKENEMLLQAQELQKVFKLVVLVLLELFTNTETPHCHRLSTRVLQYPTLINIIPLPPPHPMYGMYQEAVM